MSVTDHLANFPIPSEILPTRLRSLLQPVGMDPNDRIEVTANTEQDQYGDNEEILHMLMAVVPDSLPRPLSNFDESGDGVVAYSVPTMANKGASQHFDPAVSGHDYIVASWGDGSYYSYNLAEKVWMALGLTPRCFGNKEQRLVYDDLGMPEFGVAEGELSSEYHFQSSRNVSWKISNEYLRKYLWMRGSRGVRTFFYQAQLPDHPQFRLLMGGQSHIEMRPKDGWYDVDIMEHNGRLLLRVWATVDAVSCELCPEQTAENIAWPGVAGLVTHASANALMDMTPIYLDDKFLERYEQSDFYDTSTVKLGGIWACSPSYRGQWSFTECKRIGRNLVKVPLRELYKPKPEREILHAHSFAIDPSLLTSIDLNEEHIVSKTARLLDQILVLGDNLSKLGAIVGLERNSTDLVGFSRVEIRGNGWRNYPQLQRLSQVAALSMTQQSFLSRCKTLHEVWQKIPNGFLKLLLERAGCNRKEIRELGSIKLLQALFVIVQQLDEEEEASDAFLSEIERSNWRGSSEVMAPLFVANDLRIADAHETFSESLRRLQDLGFDTASLNQGYGRALDFVIDRVIDAFVEINRPLTRILSR